MENLTIYNAVRSVPDNAKKEIKGGRLNGKTDINPMWRLKVLTEQFGPCGIGWKPVIKKSWLEKADNGEIAAFVEIDLYYKYNGEWSEPVPGTGGSMFVAQEKNGPYVSDECYKMAYTDAISVACKALGIGADVYWSEDRTKYDEPQNPLKSNKSSGSKNTKQENKSDAKKATKEMIKGIFDTAKEKYGDLKEFYPVLAKMQEDGRITNQYPYKDKEKTVINWTEQDCVTILEDLQLPF